MEEAERMEGGLGQSTGADRLLEAVVFEGIGSSNGAGLGDSPDVVGADAAAQDHAGDARELRATARLIAHGRAELGKVIAGQAEFIDQALIAVLCHGHALVEGVPGIAKTLLVKVLGQVLGLGFQRVQATPDLMPADILGTNILRPGTDQFTFHAGPVFTDFLLVDEVNRMPPRTQAALLECMEERQVTTDGNRRVLSSAFTVFATQNPIDFEGTYPLPEAQLDRFLLKIRVSYPTLEQERTVLERHHASSEGLGDAGVVAIPAGVMDAAQREIRAIKIEPELYDYILAIVRRTREWPALALGASPRAAISLMLVSQAYAAFADRDYLLPDDVKRAALPVLRHRIVLKPEADLEGFDADRVLSDVIAGVPVPRA
ncbi:MAG TPA: MoxR family ATPase [Acidisarcina sp.]